MDCGYPMTLGVELISSDAVFANVPGLAVRGPPTS